MQLLRRRTAAGPGRWTPGAAAAIKGEPKLIELSSEVLDICHQLAETELKLTTFHTELVALQQVLQRYDDFDEKKRNYALACTSEGSFVYVLEQDVQTGEPPHAICPNCYESRQRAILQPSQATGRLKCLSCGASYQNKPFWPML